MVTEARTFGRVLRQAGQYLLVGAIVNGVKNFIQGQVESADKLKHNAERLGLTTDQLQQYTYVADLAQVSTEQAAVAFRYFNRTVGEAQLGTKGAVKTFGELGMLTDVQDKTKTTNELLLTFADRLAALPTQAQRTAFAMRTLGRGGASMLPVLQKGSAELRGMFKDIEDLGGGFNEGFVQAAHDTDVQLKRLKMGWRSMSVAILTEVLPVFTQWVNNSIKTVKQLIDLAKHTYFVRTAIVALATGATFLALKRFMALFHVGKMGVKEFLSILMRNAPLVAFLAIFAALYLVVDDFYTLMVGGKSVIGDFLDELGGAGTAVQFVKDIKEAFEKVWEAIKPARDSLKEFGAGLIIAFTNGIPAMASWVGQFSVGVVQLIDTAVTGLRTLWSLMKAGKEITIGQGAGPNTAAAGAAWDDVIKLNADWEARMKNLNHAADVFSDLDDPKKIARRAGANRAADEDFFNGAGGAGGGTMQMAPITINQTIHTSAEPKAVGAAANKGTKAALKDASTRNRDAYHAVTAGTPVATQ